MSCVLRGFTSSTYDHDDYKGFAVFGLSPEANGLTAFLRGNPDFEVACGPTVDTVVSGRIPAGNRFEVDRSVVLGVAGCRRVRFVDIDIAVWLSFVFERGISASAWSDYATVLVYKTSPNQ
jgi:hypothetical protein